jgi:CubicO group peptidase (beta-lactamase class C family)
MWSKVEGCLQTAVKDKVAPAISLLTWRGGRQFRCAAGQATVDTVFDLASLTKPLATTLLWLVSDIPWSSPLSQLLPAPRDKKDITVQQLLTHSAGLPAWRPFFKVLISTPEELRKSTLLEMILHQPLENAPGARVVYSDLGFMLLGLLLEVISGQPLARLYAAACERLQIDDHPFYLPAGAALPPDTAPCGAMPELGRSLILGQAEDENAFVVNGEAGHAGLFGSAGQVRNLLVAAYRQDNARRLWCEERRRQIYNPAMPGATRSAGFDTPDAYDSSAGREFPPGIIGHLGFTGVSFWYQPQQDLGVILLSNRVAGGRDNWKIREFRPALHDVIWNMWANDLL